MGKNRTPGITRLAAAVVLPLTGIAGCERSPATGVPSAAERPAFSAQKKGLGADVGGVLLTMNQQLEAMGLSFRVISAEWLTDAESPRAYQILVADDGSKELFHHWVPSDQRRAARGDSITYLVDLSDGEANPDLSGEQTEVAIDRAVATWSKESCSSRRIVKVRDTGADPDIADGLLGFGEVGDPFLADITHAGWMPSAFFEALLSGGGESILSVTFSFIFLDAAAGHDVDDDGKLDTAAREIYYNRDLAWGVDAGGGAFDVESVALHESGHGLSQSDFGRLAGTDPNGALYFKPLAVMNPAHADRLRALRDSDRSGHCDIWEDWPDD